MIKMLKKEKKVLENFSFLSILQLSQLGISFLIYPYLIKTLGEQKYGVLAYAQVIVSFFVLIVNYGFNATATKQIAINKKASVLLLNTVINSVFICKIALSILCYILLFILLSIVPFMNEYANIYIYTSLSLIGWCIYPEWYFQGVEKMKIITYIILISKFLSLVSIFLLIKEPSNFYLVPIIHSITMIIAGILGLFLLKKDFKAYYFKVSRTKDVLYQFRQGFSYFSSNFVANIKDYLSTILVGVFMDYSKVAVFDLANKIIKVLIIPCGIFSRAVFPKISILKSRSYVKKIEKLFLIYTLLIVVIILLIPKTIYSFLIDENLDSFIIALMYLSITLPLLALANTRGFLTLVAFGSDSKFMVGILASVLMYLIIISLIILNNNFTIITVSISIIISLLFEVMIHSFYVNKKSIEK